MPDLALDRLRIAGEGAVIAQLTHHAGTPLVLLSYHDGRRVVLNAVTLAPSQATEVAIVRAVRHLESSAPLLSVDCLTAPDAYWYAVGMLPRLPVLRLRFADPAQTWFYVDPATGEVLRTVDERQRVYRWVFNLLHRWDLNTLTLHRPAWDGLIWLFSIAGVVTSISGIWLGWKRLAR
jgi:uncharacterized iron-regulated membrane protein